MSITFKKTSPKGRNQEKQKKVLKIPFFVIKILFNKDFLWYNI